MQLSNKIIVLGVTGSISAYKAVDVASQLTQLGAEVNVIMTASATKFISPLSFSTVTKKPVTIDILAQDNQLFIPHITLAQTADVITIAPATANTIAKLATGICDNILTCTVLATKAPVAIAPAMNVNMYENSITQNNLAKLQERGFVIIGPALGKLASGKRGLGRLSPSQDILQTGTLRLPQVVPVNPLIQSALSLIEHQEKWATLWPRQLGIEEPT